jgi:hypothetical protein
MPSAFVLQNATFDIAPWAIRTKCHRLTAQQPTILLYWVGLASAGNDAALSRSSSPARELEQTRGRNSTFLDSRLLQFFVTCTRNFFVPKFALFIAFFSFPWTPDLTTIRFNFAFVSEVNCMSLWPMRRYLRILYMIILSQSGEPRCCAATRQSKFKSKTLRKAGRV